MARTWTPDLALGDATLDAQHQELFRRTAALAEALAKGEGHQRIGEVIAYLASYTVSHFRDEEAVMAAARYPGLREHRKVHMEFVRQMQQIRQEYAEDGARATLILQFYSSVCEWLVRHIGGADREFARYRGTFDEAPPRSAAPPISMGRYRFTAASLDGEGSGVREAPRQEALTGRLTTVRPASGTVASVQSRAPASPVADPSPWSLSAAVLRGRR